MITSLVGAFVERVGARTAPASWNRPTPFVAQFSGILTLPSDIMICMILLE